MDGWAMNFGQSSGREWVAGFGRLVPYPGGCARNRSVQGVWMIMVRGEVAPAPRVDV
jgi:hypothetical protein